ncbi:MAG: hypothetical protein ISQ22_07885 [Rhizobiales bacterium]|nr:hypothetical protein [Hyphomicrobiales bacterium]
MRLLEFDPRIARATQQAAAGIGQAAQKLKGPLTLRDIDGRVMQAIDELQKRIAKYPQFSFSVLFANFLDKEKKAAKVTGKIGLKYQNEKLIQNGKPNSAYIRAVLRGFYTELNKYLEKSQDKTSRDFYSKQTPPNISKQI